MEKLNFSIYPLAIAFLIGFANFKKVKHKYHWLIWFMLGFLLLNDISAKTIIEKPNTWFYNITSPIQIVLTLFIISMINKSKKIKTGIYLAIPVFILLSFLNYNLYQGDLTFNTITILPGYLLLSLFSYLTLRKNILNNILIPPIGLSFLVANIFYFVISAAAIASIPIMNELDQAMSKSLYNINLIAYSIWSLTIAAGLLWKTK